MSSSLGLYKVTIDNQRKIPVCTGVLEETVTCKGFRRYTKLYASVHVRVYLHVYVQAYVLKVFSV